MYDYTIDLKVIKPASLIDGSGGCVQVTAALSTRLVTAADSYYLRLRNASAKVDRVYITLSASTDQTLDNQDTQLTASPVLVLLPRSMTNTININYNTQLAALAQASYYLIAKLDADSGVEIGSCLNNNLAINLTYVSRTDPILVWTSCALNAVKSAGSNNKPGIGPTQGTRMMAMLATAMLDTQIGRAHV